MPTYRGTQSIAAGAIFRPDLRPNDRFGGHGGKARVRAVVVTGGAAGDILETIFIGNEMVESRGAPSLEPAANRGVDNFTPAIEAVGGPADVIDVQYLNTNAAARSIAFVIEIENA
jgi:hypothetical protein